jgi:DNA polymerase (family 10)
MPEITHRAVADFIDEYSVLLELSGENAFRIRAYTNAVRIFENFQGDLTALIAAGELTSIKGVGQSLADLITEFGASGSAKAYEDLKASIPQGLLDMLKIQGLGPKKIIAIHQKMEIDTIDGLEQACKQDQLSQLSGFGKKTQENILKSIEHLRQYQGQFRVDVAVEAAHVLLAALAAHPKTLRVELAGSLRRRKEVVKDIDLVLSSDHPEEVSQAFAAHEAVEEVLAQGETKTTVRLKNGMQADLRIVADADFPFILHHFTGSKEHNVALRARAQSRAMKLNEYGLFRGDQRQDCKDETALFAALDLSYIAPELREDMGEIEAAENETLPQLIQPKDIRGMLHVHSVYSDGENSIAEMAQAVQERGYSYLGMCDHSRSAAYAGGLQVDAVRRQQEEINQLNEQFSDFHIFKGIESDILADGALDYDDEVLASFDFIVVSVHSQFNMKEADMTRRIVRAIEHPRSTIVGHLTGRLLLEREGYSVDVNAVIEAAAACDVAIEVNANPYRLDIDWRYLRQARDRGVKIAVNTDAHRISGFDHIGHGVDMARKGWLRAEDVINTLETEPIAAYFAR